MNDKNTINSETSSSFPAITRKEFIRRVTKGAAITGGIMLAPKVLDKFLLPAAWASTSVATKVGVSDHITIPSGVLDSNSPSVKKHGAAGEDNGGWGNLTH